jgi:hypothetical protein
MHNKEKESVKRTMKKKKLQTIREKKNAKRTMKKKKLQTLHKETSCCYALLVMINLIN